MVYSSSTETESEAEPEVDVPLSPVGDSEVVPVPAVASSSPLCGCGTEQPEPECAITTTTTGSPLPSTLSPTLSQPATTSAPASHDVNNNVEVDPPDQAGPTYTWEDVQCPICLDPLMDTLVANCSHRFCKFCIKRWFRTRGQNVCPVCRSDVSSITSSRELDAAVELLSPDHLSETQIRERAVIRRVRQFDAIVFAEGLIERSGAGAGTASASPPPLRRLRRTSSPSVQNIFERWMSSSSQTTAIHTQSQGTSTEGHGHGRPESAASRNASASVTPTTQSEPTTTTTPTSAGASQPEVPPATARPTSSTSTGSESARRIRWLFEVEEVTNQFEMCVLRARTAKQRRLAAERDLNENMRRVERLYERFATLGVLTSRDEVDEIRPTSAAYTPAPVPAYRHGATQAGGSGSGVRTPGSGSRADNDDPVALMYQELDDVFGEAIFAEQSIREQEQHAATVRAMDRIAVFNTEETDTTPMPVLENSNNWPYNWNNGYGHAHAHPQSHHHHHHHEHAHGHNHGHGHGYPYPGYASWPAAGTSLNRWRRVNLIAENHMEDEETEDELPPLYQDHTAWQSVQTEYEETPMRGPSRARLPHGHGHGHGLTSEYSEFQEALIRHRADQTREMYAAAGPEVVNLTEQAAGTPGHRARRRAAFAVPNENEFGESTTTRRSLSAPRPGFLNNTNYNSRFGTSGLGDHLRAQFLQEREREHERDSFQHQLDSDHISLFHSSTPSPTLLDMYADMNMDMGLELTASETHIGLEDLAARESQYASRSQRVEAQEYFQSAHSQDGQDRDQEQERGRGSGSEQDDDELEAAVELEREHAHHTEVERQLRHLFQTYSPEGDGHGGETPEDVEIERNFTQFLLDGETLHEFEDELHEYQSADEDDRDHGGRNRSQSGDQGHHHEHCTHTHGAQYFQPSQHLPRPPSSAIAAAAANNSAHRSSGTYHFHHDGNMHAGYFTMESTRPREDGGEPRFHVLDDYGNHAAVGSGAGYDHDHGFSFHNAGTASQQLPPSRASTATTFHEGYENGDAGH